MGPVHLVLSNIAILLVFINSIQGASIPLQDHSYLDVSGKARATADYLLPTSVVPSKYVLTLTPDLDGSTFEGTVVITVNVVPEPVHSVKLHHNVKEILERTIEDSSGKVKIELNDPAEGDYDQFREIYTITPKTPMLPGEYTITIRYTGNLRDDMTGFYKSSYTTDDDVVRSLATTQFEATYARRAFPCFDEPRYKATFQINIVRKTDQTSISNSPLQETVPEEDLFRDVFVETPKMSTYLVAFIVSDFQKETLRIGDKIYNIWARENAISHATYGLHVSPVILKWLEHFTKIPFHYDKMDQAAIPDFAAGAMENWGLVTYREAALLYDKNESTTASKKRTASIIAHEFSHQWFGDLVTPEWWNNIWLNEGFATYFGHFATAAAEPEWRLEEQFVIDVHQNALQVDASALTHPIIKDVYSPEEISAIFDSISYDKAGSVIRMMEHFLTTEVFQKGLQKYLTERKYSSANPGQLFKCLNDEQVGVPILPDDLTVDTVMKTWTEQPGYPIITVNRTEENKIHINQERFIMNNDSTSDTIWIVPISYTTSGEPDFTNTSTKEWLKEKEMDLSVTLSQNDWIILNIQETAFYRVQYDTATYQSIINYLNSENFNKIHVLNRAQLIDDAFNLAFDGRLNFGTALDITKYLYRDTDYITWTSFINGIASLNEKLRNTHLDTSFKSYVKTLLANVYHTVGFSENESDDYVTKLNRINILTWACELEYKECIDSAAALFAEYKNKNKTITPDYKNIVFCTGISAGGQDEWDFLFNKYNESTVSTERSLILGYLGCSQDATILTEYMSKSLIETEVNKDEAITVFQAVYNRPSGIDVALTFLGENYDRIEAYLPNEILSIIKGIASGVTTDEQAVKMTKIIGEHGVTGGLDIIQSMLQKIAWTDEHHDTFSSWFDDYLRQPTATTPDAASSLTISFSLISALLSVVMYLHF